MEEFSKPKEFLTKNKTICIEDFSKTKASLLKKTNRYLGLMKNGKIDLEQYISKLKDEKESLIEELQIAVSAKRRRWNRRLMSVTSLTTDIMTIKSV